ncbi:UDP-N-acetylmuramoyl-L-alanyl-D-glutamate--2,6-diaminopimelate ligase [Gynuella sunshinyii]|uniref:UDP-N-acetylmuramoyl-L-alanyl-D-glutamate--2,6-diaminopimelate ligase n=1 Tax=Gynuella sunshinyii YC6258 TaxID=1445510 RepID=A0A0C5VJG1_9GAMM|nr:UDP-N-acetylmuramoyl-L-alanyl-D-glutamate--2,6-diaminopimelate ligase [Gynuella sunshinyii]AJQ94426.1 UDP-N-acetylmuramyl tripeptide synthase [Gynuella sunshinyii YC6258]
MTVLPLNRYIPDATSDLVISGIQPDSRLITKGDLFVATKGVHQDGLMFVAEAAKKGAVAVLTDSSAPVNTSLPVFRVADMPAVLSQLAVNVYDNPSQNLRVIGVTGTNGKTSTCQFIAQMLTLLHQQAAYVGTNGQGIWPNLSLIDNTTLDIVRNQQVLKQFVDNGASYCAMEVSSHGLDQQRVRGITFDCVVFTNLSRDHLDYHKTLEAYGAAKKKLFTDYDVEKAVVNLDDTLGRELLDITQLSCLSYSIVDQHADLFVTDIVFQPQGMSFNLHFHQQIESVSVGLIGRFNIANVLAATGVLIQQGYTLHQIALVLPELHPIQGRMQLITGEHQKTVSIDYSHTPDSLEKALLAMRDHCSGQLWVVFGCGGDRDSGKRPLMAQVAERFADHVVVTDDNPRTESSAAIMTDIRDGFSEAAIKSVQFIADRKQAIKHALSMMDSGDSVLIAGKGHEDYQIIGTTKHHFSDYEVVTELAAEVGL